MLKIKIKRIFEYDIEKSTKKVKRSGFYSPSFIHSLLLIQCVATGRGKLWFRFHLKFMRFKRSTVNKFEMVYPWYLPLSHIWHHMDHIHDSRCAAHLPWAYNWIRIFNVSHKKASSKLMLVHFQINVYSLRRGNWFFFHLAYIS